MYNVKHSDIFNPRKVIVYQSAQIVHLFNYFVCTLGATTIEIKNKVPRDLNSVPALRNRPRSDAKSQIFGDFELMSVISSAQVVGMMICKPDVPT